MKFWKRILNYFYSPNSRALIISLLTFFILTILWWQGSVWYQSYLLVEQRAQFSEEVVIRGNALSEAINRRFGLLQSLHAFVLTESEQNNFDSQFFIFAEDLYANTPGLNNIAVAPDGIIQIIYPEEGNEDLLGYDLLQSSSIDIVEDVRLAIESNEIILGESLDYAQEEYSLTARRAVYLDDGSFWGLINIVIDIPAMLIDAGLEKGSVDLDFKLIDYSDVVIYESGVTQEKTGVSYQLGLPEEEPWKIIGYPIEDWDALIQPDLLPIQISGMLIVMLLSSLVFVSVNRQIRLADTVRERTKEIVQINNSLEQRMAARTRELTSLLEVSQNVATSPDIQPLLSLILDRIEEVVNYDAVTIFLIEDKKNLTLLAYRGPMSREKLPNLWSLDGAEHYIEALRTRQAVIIPDVRDDDKFAVAWQQTIKQHLGESPDYILSWMGIPLLVRKRVIGLLVFHHHEKNYYSSEMANIASAFAQQAALALENARLYEQAQQVAILRERQRLARDLHDSVSQALYSVALGARAAQKIVNQQLDQDSRDKLSEPIDHIITMAEAGMNEMRALIFELRPETLENEGLISALTKQITAIQTRHRLKVEVSLCEEPNISLDLKLILYRLAQEALHNIIKHAQANHVDFKLNYMDHQITLTVGDNGQGFDTTMPSNGLGLRSMQERVEQVNGEFNIISELNKGTLISVLIPAE